MKEGIKMQKPVMKAVIITAIIVFVISYIIFSYIPDYQEKNKVNEYKRELYNSILCQYSCPLSEQVLNNKTQLAPEVSCVQSCTEPLRAIQEKGDGIANSELVNDNLIKDIEELIKNCRTASLQEDAKTTIPEVNNSIFFSCSSSGLEQLKEKYSYLN